MSAYYFMEANLRIQKHSSRDICRQIETNPQCEQKSEGELDFTLPQFKGLGIAPTGKNQLHPPILPTSPECDQPDATGSYLHPRLVECHSSIRSYMQGIEMKGQNRRQRLLWTTLDAPSFHMPSIAPPQASDSTSEPTFA